MAKPIVVNVRNGETAIPRIEAFAENVRAECNEDDINRTRPCRFEFVGVSVGNYRKDGTFDIDYECSACCFSMKKTVVVNMYDVTLDRGNTDVTS